MLRAVFTNAKVAETPYICCWFWCVLQIGNERARHAALVLNLLAAQALLGTGQLTDAGRIFVRLSQRVSEGEVAFGSEAVGMPATSIRQQAIR